MTLRVGSSGAGGVLVAVLAFLGTVLLAGRGLEDLRTSVLGLGGDPYQTLWRFDGLAKAIAQGSLTLAGDPIRNYGPLPWLPLHLLLGEPLAYNVIWLLQGPLAALATYALGRTLGLRPFPAGVAGILAAFAPYRIAQSLGHFGAMQIFWIPATLAVFLAWLRSPKFSSTILLALLLVGASWTEHTLFLTTLIAIAVGGICFFDQLRTLMNRPRAKLLGVILLLLTVGGAVLPFHRELFETARSTSRLNPGPEQRLRFAPTLESLLSKASFHALSTTPEPYGTSARTVADHTHALGLAAVILAGISALQKGAKGNRRPTLFLVVLALAGIGLAVAPRSPMLAWTFERLPIVSALRAVDRFLVLPAFALPLLASGVLRDRPRCIRVLLAGLLMLEVLPRVPFPAQSAVIPAFYKTLAAERPGSLLEVPGATDYLVASKAVYASVIHGREVLGSIAFERVEDPQKREALLRVPFLRDVLLLRLADLQQPTFFGQRPTDIAHAAFASEHVVAVVLHGATEERPVLRLGPSGRPEPASTDDISGVQAILRAAGFSEEHVGHKISLYRIPEWPSTRSAAVAVRGPGWNGVKRRSDDVAQARLTAESQFEIRVLGAAPLPLAVTFRIADRSASGDVRLTGPSGAIQTKRARPGESIRWILDALPPGRHAYQFRVDGTEIIIENPTLRIGT